MPIDWQSTISTLQALVLQTDFERSERDTHILAVRTAGELYSADPLSKKTIHYNQVVFDAPSTEEFDAVVERCDCVARLAAPLVGYTPSPPWAPSTDFQTVFQRCETLLQQSGAGSVALITGTLRPLQVAMLSARVTTPPSHYEAVEIAYEPDPNAQPGTPDAVFYGLVTALNAALASAADFVTVATTC